MLEDNCTFSQLILGCITQPDTLVGLTFGTWRDSMRKVVCFRCAPETFSWPFRFLMSHRRLVIRSHKFSSVLDRWLDLPNRSGVWQTFRMQWYGTVCQISKRCKHRGLEALWDHFSHAIFKWKKFFLSWLKFFWRLLARNQLKINHHRFGTWFDTEQATSDYLNQWWTISLYASPGLSISGSSSSNLIPTGYKQWRTEYMSEKITTKKP